MNLTFPPMMRPLPPARWAVLLLLLLAGAGRAGLIDPATLHPSTLRAVALDSLGLLWLGGLDGLASWDGRHLVRLDLRSGWEGGGASALTVDRQGRLWVAADSGLFRREESFRPVELNSPVGLGRARALLSHGEATWLATERGLLLVHDRLGERVLLSGMAVSCLALLPGGDLVCGTLDRGIYRFDAEGNPAAMRESYRRVLGEVAAIEPEPGGDLLLLGRLGGVPQLARLSARDGTLVALPDRVPDTPPAAPLALSASPVGILVRSGAGWQQWTGRELIPLTLPAAALPLPAPFLTELHPALAWLRPEGRLQIQSQASGMLAQQEGRMALAWESPRETGGWRPLQTCRTREGQWMLLASGGERRLLAISRGATREPALDWLEPAAARVFQPGTICPEPGSGALLIGLPGQILRAAGPRLDTLSRELGANWMVPFTPASVLVGGARGLALLEDGELKRLRVADPVHRATPDGFGGILAACDRYLLRLNELNEVDTLAYPEQLAAGRAAPGQALRQILADGSGRIWLLGERRLHLRAREGAPWTRPLAGLLGESADGESGEILSMAADSSGRLWLSTSRGTGWLVPDRLPPVALLLQDARELEAADRRLILLLGAADPLGTDGGTLVRVRLDDQPWGAWRAPGPLPLDQLLPAGVTGGTFRLQLQAMDAWGNLSRQSLALPLVLPAGQGRLPFAKRLFLLVAMVGIAVTATILYPGRSGLLISLGLGAAAGFIVRVATTEPHLWWALPLILGLSSYHTSDRIRARRAKTVESPEPGVLEVVDLLRDFGHSGSATRNLDRLLRSARNLYLEGRPDPEILGRYRTARGVFLDLTAPSLQQLMLALRRLPPAERPLAGSDQERLEGLVADAVRLLEGAGDPPAEAALVELAFNLDRLEQALAATQHGLDLRISSAPLKVLDRVLEDRAAELAGVELELRCEREVRQVLARLPVDKLQFILDNLVDNALHWMDGLPRRRLAIEVRERPSTLQLRVTDSGAGMTPERLARIFEAGVSGRAGGEGRGYGLYRSREILARFGGALTVERSEPGQGSTFLLEIKKVEPEGRQGSWNAS
ncbi:MAG: ATP-binding protein [bacterium]|nr:ATP-binding protein [bacterium]